MGGGGAPWERCWYSGGGGVGSLHEGHILYILDEIWAQVKTYVLAQLKYLLFA
jgi:hypothetical protein